MTDFMIDGSTKLYGIIGNPVKHSFSPKMHNPAFKEINLNAVYVPFLINENDLPSLLESFRITGVCGFNITVPFKEKIIPFLDDLSDEARLLGSVNTVKKTNKGWVGYSTDGSGFIRSIKESGFDFNDKKVLLIGAGGSAKAVAIALAKQNIKELIIFNRTSEKAIALEKLVKIVKPDLKTKVNPDVENFIDLMVNCTSVGMINNNCPVGDDFIKASHKIVDIVYNPAMTTLLNKAQQYNKDFQNGIGMLLYQGVESFEIWTGKKAPVELMKKCLLNTLDS